MDRIVRGMQRFSDIFKSRSDSRAYRGLVLENGLKVLLASDPTTDKSAAAMDVHVGNMCDPWEIPGLAHFLEHMLFMGTKKYPEENEYSKFLSTHNGSSNAFTTDTHTQYYFDVAPDDMGGALDRFAQFFLEPLFTESATEREMMAVNSENQKNFKNDAFRLHMVQKQWADPNHDFAKLGNGSLRSLKEVPDEKGICLRDELLKFHETWYSSNIMALSVLGKQDLDALEEMVVQLFSGVRNTNVAIPRWENHPFAPGTGLQTSKVVPVKDIRQMTMYFPIGDLNDQYETSPDFHLSHLLGHEGKGSVLSELKARKWCNSLTSGASSVSGFGFFTVSTDLTLDGMEHVDDVVELVFQYLNLLRQTGVQGWIFEENRNIRDIWFHFKDKERPQSYVCTTATQLQKYPMQHAVYGPYCLSSYKPELIEDLLSKLVPDNVRVRVVAQSFEEEAKETEPWFGAKYTFGKVKEKTALRWKGCETHPSLKICELNPFIPTDFELRKRDAGPGSELPRPSVVRQTDLVRLWFKQDTEFLLPKACMFVELMSPIAYVNPTHANYNALFAMLFNDYVVEDFYPAEIAGLSISMSNNRYGLTWSVAGYNDKMSVLVEKFLETLARFKVDGERFKVIKENYSRGLRNHQMSQPYQHAMYYNSAMLAQRYWTKENLLACLDDIDADQVRDYVPRLFLNLYVECLVGGNLSFEQAIELGALLENRLKQDFRTQPLSETERLKDRELRLDPGTNLYHLFTNQVHKTTGIESYYQCGMQDTENNVLLELFSQLINEPCFNVLRTQEQLGYIVHGGTRRSNGVQGLRFIVQSDRDPKYLDGRIEEFLGAMRSHVKSMSDEEFETNRQSLLAKKLEKPKRLLSRLNLYWTEIVSRQFNFERDAVEVEALRAVTKSDVLKFFDEHFDRNSTCRKKLSCHVVPSDTSELKPVGDLPADKVELISTASNLKSQLGLFPLAKPFQDPSTLVRKV